MLVLSFVCSCGLAGVGGESTLTQADDSTTTSPRLPASGSVAGGAFRMTLHRDVHLTLANDEVPPAGLLLGASEATAEGDRLVAIQGLSEAVFSVFQDCDGGACAAGAAQVQPVYGMCSAEEGCDDASPLLERGLDVGTVSVTARYTPKGWDATDQRVPQRDPNAYGWCPAPASEAGCTKIIELRMTIYDAGTHDGSSYTVRLVQATNGSISAYEIDPTS